MAFDELPRLHPRYFKVTEARLDFTKILLKAEEKHDLSINAIVEILLLIAIETNKVETLKDRKDPDLDEIGMVIYRELVAQEKTHGLTPAESVKNLLDVASSTHKYAIRLERHPDDPDKKGDEA